MAHSSKLEETTFKARVSGHVSTHIRTGVPGLDELTCGGLPQSRMYLVQGEPGAGKTTLGLQFLLEGLRNGERVQYITLAESREELHAAALSHGWSLDGVEIYDSLALAGMPLSPESQSIFHSSEVELAETMELLQGVVEAASPKRLVLDSLSELRLLASDPLRFRRQILALKAFFMRMECTVLMIEDDHSHPSDMPLRSLVHGVIELRREVLTFGRIHRRMEVSKLRGVGYREGLHDYAIRTGGLIVFPRLVLADQKDVEQPELISSGLESLDSLLGGGLPRGFSCLLIGPAGVGKSTIGFQYAFAAAERGEKSAIFLFDERPETALANAVGRKLAAHWKRGLVSIRQVDPAELSPGEFAHMVRRLALEERVTVVCIDGLDGFVQGMPGEKHLLLHLHELTSFLGQHRVTTMMTKVQHGMMSRDMLTGADLTYISDAALMFRYFEFQGEVKQALSVLKKRSGTHERTIREMRITEDGPWIGAPLERFRGILSGIPEYQGIPLKESN